MRTIKKIIVIFMLVVLATSMATVAVPTKAPIKTVMKLGSSTSVNKSNVTAENVTKMPTKATVMPGANANVNKSSSTVNAELPTKNTIKAIAKFGSNASLNKSNATKSSLSKVNVKPGSNSSVNQSNVSKPAAVGINLAFHKHANQSSLMDDNQVYNASKGIDNSLTTFFLTKNESNPWWQVDLGKSYPLNEVDIHNIQECCQDRARTLNVFLSNDSVKWKQVYSNVKDNGEKVFGLKGEPLRINLNGEQARFVRLQLQEKNFLDIAEVEIFEATNLSKPVVPHVGSNSMH